MGKVKILSSNNLHGDITLPASKSVLHRLLIASMLCDGTSIIHHTSLSDDILATISCCEALGAKIEVLDEEIKVIGVSNFHLDHDVTLNCGESGTTLRLLIPICTLFDRDITIIGKESLFVRPLYVYEKLFSENNAKFERDGDKIIVGGKLTNFSHAIDGSISSQFISGIMFVCAMQEKNITLKVHKLQSVPYVNLTIETLKRFGVHIDFNHYLNKIKVYGGTKLRPVIEESSGDYSHAGNFFVLRALTSSSITFHGLDPLSMQGDKAIIRIIDNYFKHGQIYANEKKGLLKRNKDIVIDVKDIPDLGPIIMVLLTHSGGYIKNFKRLIFKESNRVLSMIEELRKFGVVVKEEGNKLYIPKYMGEPLRGDIDSHNDHRICMAMVIMALCYHQDDVVVNDYEVVNKSYPNFFKDLERIGVKLEYHN